MVDEAGAQSGSARVVSACPIDTFFVDQQSSAGLTQYRRPPEKAADNKFLNIHNVLSLNVKTPAP